MSQLSFHPAPGLGDLTPGFFVVPSNPIRNDSTVLVPSVQASAGGRIVRKPHIGEFVAASFVVPSNPIRRNLATGMMGLGGGMGGCGGMGCGCGTPDCGGGYGYNPYGLQGLDLTSIEAWAQQPSFVSPSVPNWMLYGGAAAAAYFLLMPGGSEYRQKRSALRSQYRGYRRAARSAA
jgi:hypothetical protein